MRLKIMVSACAVLALAVGLATATAGTGNGGNSANAKACQKDGWNYQRRSDGSSFTNQSDCVSYAASGNALTTVVADVSLSAGWGNGGGFLGLTFCATNAGPSAVTITVRSEGVGSLEGNPLPQSGQQTVTILPGESQALSGTNVYSFGLTLDAFAQVTAANALDPDSTPNNYKGGLTGAAVEDDESVVHLIAGTVGTC